MQKRNSLLYISFIFVTLTMLVAFAVSAIPKSEYDVFVGKVTRNLRKCMGAREASSIEYDEVERKTSFWMATLNGWYDKNIYLDVKKENMQYVEYSLNEQLNVTLSNALTDSADFEQTKQKSEIELEHIFLFYNDCCLVNCEDCSCFVQIYEFTNEENAIEYYQYQSGNCKADYTFYRYPTVDMVWPNVNEARDIGILEKDRYMYYVYEKYAEENCYVVKKYYRIEDNRVITIIFSVNKNDKLYSQHEEFMKQMQFEGIDDIVLEPVEIVD